MNSAHDLDRDLQHWFHEDIGDGDHTTLSTIPEAAPGTATLRVKQDGILAGVDVARRIFQHFDPLLSLENPSSRDTMIPDGSRVVAGDQAFSVRGPVRSILQCERLVLNVMQRMSGIATSTRAFVDRVEGTGAKILDTRKTTPGFRWIEKEAVRLGGGENHRFGLYDMIMIKDNHIDFAGGIEQAIKDAVDYLEGKGLDLKIEVETRSLEDVKKVLKTRGVHRIMLDNFSVELTRQAVDLIAGSCETESSGGITLESIRDYAECGVDYISVGAVTHQVKSLDLSLKAVRN